VHKFAVCLVLQPKTVSTACMRLCSWGCLLASTGTAKTGCSDDCSSKMAIRLQKLERSWVQITTGPLAQQNV